MCRFCGEKGVSFLSILESRTSKVILAELLLIHTHTNVMSVDAPGPANPTFPGNSRNERTDYRP